MECEKECNNFVTCWFSGEGKYKPTCNFFIAKNGAGNYSLGEWSDSDVEMPEIDMPVLGVLEHFNSRKKQHAVVVHVDADDHSWQSDGCEIAHEYNVIRWATLPTLD